MKLTQNIWSGKSIEDGKNTKQMNYGISLLKCLMCFSVVLYHFWDYEGTNPVLKFIEWTGDYAVPIFVMVSFMFVYKKIVKHEKSVIINRFERLYIPQIFWTIAYWCLYKILSIFEEEKFDVSISDFFWQLILGHSKRLNPSMWYQVDVLIITGILIGLVILFKKYRVIGLSVVCLLAYILQYSGINLLFYQTRYEICYPLGRLAEIMPLAIVGMIIAEYNIFDRMKEKRLLSLILASIVILVFFALNIVSITEGYGYQGIEKMIVGVAFIVLFYLLPFEKTSSKTLFIVDKLTRYKHGIK